MSKTLKQSLKNYLKSTKNIDEENGVWHNMKITLQDGKEIEIKSNELAPLKTLAENIKDAKQQLENLGLPLTIQPHEKPNISLLSGGNTQEFSMRGMVNLMILLLICYHIRMIVQSL